MVYRRHTPLTRFRVKLPGSNIVGRWHRPLLFVERPQKITTVIQPLILRPSTLILAAGFWLSGIVSGCSPRATITVQDTSPVFVPRYAEGCVDNPDGRVAACRDGFRRASLDGDTATAGQLLLLSQGNAPGEFATTMALWLNPTPWLPATLSTLKDVATTTFVPMPVDARGALVTFNFSADMDDLPPHCPALRLPIDPPQDTQAIETATLAAAAAGAVAIAWEHESKVYAAPALPLLAPTLGGHIPVAHGLQWAIFAGRADFALRLGELRNAHAYLTEAIQQLPDDAASCLTRATLTYWLWWIGRYTGDVDDTAGLTPTAAIDTLCTGPGASSEDQRFGMLVKTLVHMELSLDHEPLALRKNLAQQARSFASGASTRTAALLSAMANALEFNPETLPGRPDTTQSQTAEGLATQLSTVGRPNWAARFGVRGHTQGVLDRFGRADRKRIQGVADLLNSRSHRWHAGVTATETLVYIAVHGDISHDRIATLPLCAIVTDTIRSWVAADPKPTPTQRAWWLFRLAAIQPVCADEKPLNETLEILAPKDEPLIFATALLFGTLHLGERPQLSASVFESIGTWARMRAQTLENDPNAVWATTQTLLVAAVSAWLNDDRGRFWPTLKTIGTMIAKIANDAGSETEKLTRSQVLTLKFLSAIVATLGDQRFSPERAGESSLPNLDRVLSEDLPELLEVYVPETHRLSVQRLVRLTRSLLDVFLGITPSAGDQLDWTVLVDSVVTLGTDNPWDRWLTTVKPLLWATIAIAQQRLGDAESARISRQQTLQTLRQLRSPTHAVDPQTPPTIQTLAQYSLILPLTFLTLSRLDSTPNIWVGAANTADQLPKTITPGSPTWDRSVSLLRVWPSETQAPADPTGITPESAQTVATAPPSTLQNPVITTSSSPLEQLAGLLDLVSVGAPDTDILSALSKITDDLSAEPMFDALLPARAVLEQRAGLADLARSTLQRYLSAVHQGSPGDTWIRCGATAHHQNHGAETRGLFRLGLLVDSTVFSATPPTATPHTSLSTQTSGGIGRTLYTPMSNWTHCTLERPPGLAVDLVLESASALAVVAMMNNDHTETDTCLAVAVEAAQQMAHAQSPVVSDIREKWFQWCRQAITTPGRDTITTAAWATALGRLRGHGLVSQELDSAVWHFAAAQHMPVSSTFVHSAPIPRLFPQNHQELLRIRPLAVAWSLAQRPTDTGTLVAASRALSFRTVLVPPWGAQLAGDVLRAALGDVPTSVVNSPLVKEDTDPVGHAVTAMWRNLMRATGTQRVSPADAEEIITELTTRGLASEATLYAARLADIAINANQPEVAVSLATRATSTLKPQSEMQTEWLRGRVLDTHGRALAASGKMDDAALMLETANQTFVGYLNNRAYYEKLLAAINVRGSAGRYTADLERDTERLATYLGRTFGYQDPMVFRLQTATLAIKIQLDRPWSTLSDILNSRTVPDNVTAISEGKRFVTTVRSLEQKTAQKKLATAYLNHLFRNGPVPE